MKEFLELVEKMRQAQKDYFKTRHHGIMIRAKKLEQEVDKQLEQLIKQSQNTEGNDQNWYKQKLPAISAVTPSRAKARR